MVQDDDVVKTKMLITPVVGLISKSVNCEVIEEMRQNVLKQSENMQMSRTLNSLKSK